MRFQGDKIKEEVFTKLTKKLKNNNKTLVIKTFQLNENHVVILQLLTRLQLPNILFFKAYLEPHNLYETTYFLPPYKTILLFLMLVL